MLLTSRFQCFCASSAMICVRIIRAACRPSVECSTAGVNVVLAIDPAVSSVFVAHLTLGLCPSATPASTCASGPTCIGCPLKRGALTQEYLPLSWKDVYLGSVCSSDGCVVPCPVCTRA